MSNEDDAFVESPFDYAFQTKKLEEDRGKEKRETVNVSINKEERAMLDELKRQFNTPLDSTALKIGARVGLNVLQGTFGKELLPWLLSSKRRKGDDGK